MVLNVLTDEGIERYNNVIFSERGNQTLLNYVTELSRWYMDTSTVYPFKQPIILGIPQLMFAEIIESRELLFERIKTIMHLLGKKNIGITLPNGTIKTFSINVKDDDIHSS